MPAIHVCMPRINFTCTCAYSHLKRPEGRSMAVAGSENARVLFWVGSYCNKAL